MNIIDKLDSHEGVLERRETNRLDGMFQVKFTPLPTPLAEQMYLQANTMGLNADFSLDNSLPAPTLRGVTANVSVSGFCLVSNTPMPLGTHVLMDVNLPGLPRPLRTLTEVMRTNPAPSNPSLTRYGLRIVAAHPGAIAMLQELVNEGLQRKAS
jgi:hypothetical protein